MDVVEIWNIEIWGLVNSKNKTDLYRIWKFDNEIPNFENLVDQRLTDSDPAFSQVMNIKSSLGIIKAEMEKSQYFNHDPNYCMQIP